MPEWVKEVIRNASPRQSEDFKDLQKELQNLLNRYKVKVTGRKIDVQGGPSTDERGESRTKRAVSRTRWAASEAPLAGGQDSETFGRLST